MPKRNTWNRYSIADEKDPYRKRFDTSDAIILPMVQKGKVEETILESIPQLVIQLLNTWLLGQLQSMPPLTIFSISLSVISLTNTLWYYAYWNLFRCMPIRDVPSTLALYNYKLSGVTDGAFSFAKTSSEVVEIELSEVEKMRSVTVGGTVLNDDGAGHGQLDQLPPKNAMALSPELTRSIGGVVLRAGESQGSCDLMPDDVDKDAEISRLRRGNEMKEAENSKLREEQQHQEQANQEKEACIAKLRQDKQQMEDEIIKLRLELQRLSSIALESADAYAQVTDHSLHAAAATDDSVVLRAGESQGSCDPMLDHVDEDAEISRLRLGNEEKEAENSKLREEQQPKEEKRTDSPSSPSDTLAAVTIQSVTRGHLGRRQFQARCSQVTRQLTSEQ